jgi:DNA repair exonuclease SbcCD ATPase subunit
MPINGAQVDEGQVQVSEIDADITGLSIDEIDKRIEDDAAFAKAYAAGRIVDKNAKPGGEADAGAPEKPEAPAQTPADQKGGAGDKAEPKPSEQVFTIKAGELPEGFDTPGKVFKSLSEKQRYIETQHETVRQKNERIQELEKKLEAETAAKKLEADKRSDAAEEITDQNLYDPEYMKKALKRLQRMDAIEKELEELKTTVTISKAEETQKKEIDQELTSIGEFQNKFPALKTKASINELDAKYAKFVEGVAKVVGTSKMEDALKYVNVFIQDKGEDGDNLRKALLAANVKAPEELSAYLRVMNIRQTAQNRQLSLEEAFRMMHPDLYLKAGNTVQVDPPKPPSVQEKIVTEKELQRQEAERLASGAAVDIPPAASGAGETVDDLTDQQIEELLAMKPEQLRRNPAKKKLLDAIYVKIGLPVLNLKGQKDALS